MNKFVIVGASLLASSAFAGSLDYDFRFDADNTQYNAASATADKTNFTMQTGRLDYKGKAGDDLSFRLRARFNRDANTSTKYSSLGGNIDMAYISQNLGSGLTFTAGKFASEVGGFEGVTAGADVYFKSQAYRDVDYGTTSLTGASSGSARALNLIYQTGFKLAYAYADNEAALVLSNNDSDSAAATDDQTRPTAGLVWKGKFMDKALQTMISYYTVAPNAGGADKNNLASVGVKWDAGSWYVQGDYDAFTFTNAAASGGKDETTMSTVLEGGYKMDKHTIKAKVESSEIKYSAAETKKKFTGAGLAYEFKPMADVNYRYHVAYTTRTTAQDGAQDKIESHVIAGVRFMGDFLK